MQSPEESGKAPPEPKTKVVRAKAERITPEPIFTAERDQKLDPLRGRIAVALTILLCSAMVLHAGLTFWASYGTPDAVKNISAVFNIWVPIVAGLASSAVTWFFTRKGRQCQGSEPKKLVVLEGSAHAQYLFDTDQAERVMAEILSE